MLKTKFTRKDLILDQYIRGRYKELYESKQFHEESLKRIRKEMNQLLDKKLDLRSLRNEFHRQGN
jgi:hypothetical protein